MKLTRLRVFDGPNVHSHHPVIECLIDLGPLDEVHSMQLPGFVDRLLGELPGLAEHYCSLGRPGGFLERLREGTYMGHIVEHAVLELQTMAGQRVIYGKTRRTEAPGVYRVVFEYRNEAAARLAVDVGLELVGSVARDGRAAVSVALAVAEMRRLAAQTGLGPSSQAIWDAARARGIPVRRLDEDSLLQLGLGARQHRLRATLTDRAPCVAVDAACDKHLTRRLLEVAHVPVPEGGLARTPEEAVALAERLGWPVVVKPRDGNQGRGVNMNLVDPRGVREAFDRALRAAGQPAERGVIVERQLEGRNFRLLVVGDRLVAAAERLAPVVIGDGRQTVRQLVEAMNADPNRGQGHERPLTRVPLDDGCAQALETQGLTFESVPEAGRAVVLRLSANLSTGATARDVTDEVHPAVADVCLRAARAIGLDVAGVDVMAPSLDRPLAVGAVIEVNAAPGIRMHHFPSQGRPRDAAGAIVESLFPAGEDGRIPVVAVTGTNGKTTTARLIAHFLEMSGRRTGLTTTDGIWIGRRQRAKGDLTGCESARQVLSDPSVEAAVLETARGGILRRGLGFEECDVSVVTNIAADHLGQDGVMDLTDLAHVKSLVVEATRRGGAVVLNADDPLVLDMRERTDAEAVLFGLRPDHLPIRRHLQDGGRAVYVRRGIFCLAERRSEIELVAVRQVPVTFRGLAEHNVQNALAAAAAGWALGLGLDVLRAGLRSFAADYHNPGRMNLARHGDIWVLIDYGHNAHGIEATLRAAQALGRGRLIGVVGVPGDRRDEDVIAAGEVAGRHLAQVWVKEDVDRRGRAPGEVARLLVAGVKKGRAAAGRVLIPAQRSEGDTASSEAVQTELDEVEAIQQAVASAEPGDLVVVFYESYERARAAVAEAVALRRARRPRSTVLAGV